LNGRPRYAHVGEQPAIKFEKLPVLASAFPRQFYSGQPRNRNFPPSKAWKEGNGASIAHVELDVVLPQGMFHLRNWSETTLGCGS